MSIVTLDAHPVLEADAGANERQQFLAIEAPPNRSARSSSRKAMACPLHAIPPLS